MGNIYLEDTCNSLPECSRLAQEAEKEGKWGEAHHYWMRASMGSTANKQEIKRMQLNALRVFEKWQKSI